ncbi:MAG: L-2-amino-thiazoline-4-carboxylic acid hydrolase [Desulfobacterales bacterium]|nr:L-2-amino-thiazoline-4-carboxylic acid hydrolase [Desulfobacterales bacterium]
MNCHQRLLSNPSRRNFLIYTSMSASLLFLGPARNTDLVWASTGNEYYVLNKEKFMAGFEKTYQAANTYLKAKYGDQVAQEICKKARNEFTHLLPDIPYIGGDKHPGTKWMLLSGHWIAFLRPMQEKGHSTQEAAQMMYTLYADYLKTLPKEKMVKKGEYMFTQEFMDIMKNWAQKTQGQKVDWVADFIPGDGKSFDWGIDYHYCPCFDYFKAQGAADIAPYFCLVDFPEHKMMGTGLVRTKTLAQGDKICDFRYKKGRAVTQGWSTEISKFQG